MKIKKSELLALIKEREEAPFGRGMTMMPDAADDAAVPASMEKGGSMDQIYESAVEQFTREVDDQLSIISNYLATQMPDANPQKLGYNAYSVLVDLGLSVPSIQDVEGYINREMDDREEDLMQEGIEGIMDPANQQLMMDAMEKLAPLVGAMSLPVLISVIYEKLKEMGAK
jgi:hypothetical protein